MLLSMIGIFIDADVIVVYWLRWQNKSNITGEYVRKKKYIYCSIKLQSYDLISMFQSNKQFPKIFI